MHYQPHRELSQAYTANWQRHCAAATRYGKSAKC